MKQCGKILYIRRGGRWQFGPCTLRAGSLKIHTHTHTHSQIFNTYCFSMATMFSKGASMFRFTNIAIKLPIASLLIFKHLLKPFAVAAVCFSCRLPYLILQNLNALLKDQQKSPPPAAISCTWALSIKSVFLSLYFSYCEYVSPPPPPPPPLLLPLLLLTWWISGDAQSTAGFAEVFLWYEIIAKTWICRT